MSATQIDTFELCERKWGWDKIARVPRKPNKFLDRGIDLHDIAEAFLKTGALPPETDAGRVFKPGIKYLPAPGTCIVEGKFFWYPENEPFGIVGKIDWERQDIVGIGDHKTTSDKKWIKTPEELQTNIQVVTYCARTASAREADEVACRWLYYIWNPKRPKAVPVDFVMPLPHIVEQWERVAEIGRRMVLRLEQQCEVTDLPYSIEACGKYSGCPYLELCGIPPAERIKSLMAQLSLKEKMAARAAEKAAVNPPEQPASEPEPQPQPEAQAAAPAQSLKERMQACKGAAPAAATKPPPNPAPPPKTAAGADYAAVAEACQKISEGFAAISRHFSGM